MKTWKQIEASRERRLWITQVIMPGAYLVWLANWLTPQETKDEYKRKIKNKYTNIKAKLRWRKKEKPE